MVENFEDFEDDELTEIELQNGGLPMDDPNMYVDENTKFDEENKVQWNEEELKEGIESEENYNELVEKVQEYLNGNHPF